MKINEKNLTAYSVSNTPIDKEGYLLKRGEVNKNFQRRWFVLKGNLLFYFEKKGDKEPIGVIILEGCTVELAECDDQYTFNVVFNASGGRCYCLATDSQDSLESWMKALARASYDYLKLMVAELQKQLDELNDSDGHSNQVSDGSIDCHRDPPRRLNPFNKPENMNTNDASVRLRSNTVSHQQNEIKTNYQQSSRNIPSRTAPLPPSNQVKQKKYVFSRLHAEYGVRILSDREKYFGEKQSNSQPRAETVPETTVLLDLEGDKLSVEITEKMSHCHGTNKNDNSVDALTINEECFQEPLVNDLITF